MQRRIAVKGSSGSGKSTLATQLAQRLDIADIEHDAGATILTRHSYLRLDPRTIASRHDVFLEPSSEQRTPYRAR